MTDPESVPARADGEDPLADPLADPAYRDAVVDLLGVLAYGELTAFYRLAHDARLAPTIADKGALGAMAVAEFGHYQRLDARLVELGVDPEEAMGPYMAALDGFHEQTKPADWFEGLIKAYVGDGIGTDFYRAMADYLDPQSRALVLDVLADTGHADFVVEHVLAGIASDPRLGGRLALWGRRLLGEALAQAQRVAAERDTLAPLFTGGPDRPGADLAVLTKIFSQLTDAHTRRMAALGLSA